MAEDQNQVGKRFRSEGGVIRTPEQVVSTLEKQAPYAVKPNAMPILSYFAHKGITNPVMHASMLAYTEIRVATVEDFDAIFKDH